MVSSMFSWMKLRKSAGVGEEGITSDVIPSSQLKIFLLCWDVFGEQILSFGVLILDLSTILGCF